MRICVAGLWHLGVVTAACVASSGQDVIAFDEDQAVVDGLRRARLPVAEPGLPELVRRTVAAGTLDFTNEREQALRGSDLLWITYDTPVDAQDRADVEFVVQKAQALIDAADPATVIIVSSQLPVGSTRRLEQYSRGRFTFAYAPENLRLGDAIAAFTRPDRIVVGIRPTGDRRRIQELLSAFSDRIEWMGIESAELVKHGLNAFLATSIAFANELAGVAERVGADAGEVERGLKTDPRVGHRAYLRPGAAFAGGTLGRDLEYLARIGDEDRVPLHLLRAVRVSNDAHKRWALQTVGVLLEDGEGSLDGHTVGVWGLVYTTGTDTLRRSSSVELCRELAEAGARVRAHDAAVRALPDELANLLTLCGTPLEAAAGASAVVIETDWPQYQDVEPESLVAAMRTPNVVDANGFLSETLGRFARVHYVRFGSLA